MQSRQGVLECGKGCVNNNLAKMFFGHMQVEGKTLYASYCCCGKSQDNAQVCLHQSGIAALPSEGGLTAPQGQKFLVSWGHIVCPITHCTSCMKS